MRFLVSAYMKASEINVEKAMKIFEVLKKSCAWYPGFSTECTHGMFILPSNETLYYESPVYFDGKIAYAKLETFLSAENFELLEAFCKYVGATLFLEETQQRLVVEKEFELEGEQDGK